LMNKQKWMILIKVQKNIYKNYNLGRLQAALLFIFQFLFFFFLTSPTLRILSFTKIEKDI
jgi:hypothetical protein